MPSRDPQDFQAPLARARRRALSVRTFCAEHEVGKTKTYELINSGKIDSVLVGGKRLIDAESADRWWRDLLKNGGAK